MGRWGWEEWDGAVGMGVVGDVGSDFVLLLLIYNFRIIIFD